MSTMVPMYGFGGGGGTGAALTVTAPSGCTVTVTKDGKTKTKVADSSGLAVFKGLATGAWTVSISDGEQTAQKSVTITADYSTAITFFTATIHVTYPAGFTCTATDGVTTLTAPDTSGTWDCVVPNAAVWTLTCGDVVKKVDISTNGSTVIVPLAYLIYQGGYCKSFTGGYSSHEGVMPTSVSGGLRFSTSTSLRIRNNNPVTVKPFSKICVSISSFTKADWIRLCFGDNRCVAGSNISGSVIYAEYVLSNAVGVQKFAIPDTIPDDVYVSFGCYNCNFTISDIWLE